MRYHTACLLFCLLTAACANVDPGDPPVDTAKLAQVLAELHLAESLVAEVPVVVRDSVQSVYYESVLADHGYTRAEFDSIMWIIRSEPIWIDSLYTQAGVIVARDMVEE